LEEKEHDFEGNYVMNVCIWTIHLYYYSNQSRIIGCFRGVDKMWGEM